MNTIACEIGALDSDSVSPGSNPGSPASLFPLIDNMLEEICNRGNPRIVGKFGQYVPHKSRHSFIKRLGRICDSGLKYRITQRNSVSDYTRLADIYEATGINIKLLKVPTPAIERAISKRLFNYSNETEAHSRLRSIGREMAIKPLNEFTILGARVDIIDKAQNLIIECGNVTARRISQILADGTYHYYIIPFQDSANEWFENGHGRPVYYWYLSYPMESRVFHHANPPTFNWNR